MNRIVLFILLLTIVACTVKRIQEPTGELPYRSEDITFKSSDGAITLAGTLTSPSAGSKVAVVLIGGSGRTDRNARNQFDHQPFLVLADYLTRNGIVVLRFDERGVGQSGGSYPKMTFDELASDVASGVKLLRDHGYAKVGIIGHSEGGQIASVASQQTPADFLVLMGVDNFTADITLTFQTAMRLKAMKVDPSVSEDIVATLDELLTIAKNVPDTVEAKKRMEKVVAEKQKSGSDEYNKVSRELGNPGALIRGFLDPKFSYRLNHTTRQTLKQVRVPVLVLYGDDDNAINVRANVAMIENALDSTQHEVKIFPEVGHLFMNSKGVEMKDLRKMEETIAPVVLESIKSWIGTVTN